MSRDFKLLICSLNMTSSDTTRHDTGLGTGLSLVRVSGDCSDFAKAFLFDGMTDFGKGCRDNDIWCHYLANCRSRGVTLIFSYIRRLGSFFFLVQNFEFQYFWGFQINEYFWGIKLLWIFFGVITIIDYI